MKKILLIVICVASAFSFASTVKKEETVKPKNTNVRDTSKVDKADELITNRRFRAQNGSLSRFSMNTSISYSGGSLDKPFAADRPNISNAGDTTSIAGISGSLNGSFRLNKLNRLNLGTGIQMLAPFNSTIDTDDPAAEEEFKENRGVLDIVNPYFSYTHMNKFFGVQTIATLGVREYTASNFRARDYKNDVNFSLNTMYNVGDSGFSFGALFLYTKYLFDKDDRDLREKQNDVVYGFLPQAEYVINDTFNLRTIVRSNWYQNSRADVHDFAQRAVTQSVGLGISVNRDVFLYPNIQFVYRDLQAANTNIGFTANINTF
jgi:hypothetical protein